MAGTASETGVYMAVVLSIAGDGSLSMGVALVWISHRITQLV